MRPRHSKGYNDPHWGHWICPRVKHALRRWFNFHQRVLAKQVHLVHVPGAQIPADFLTKWVTKQKYYDSLNYLTNSVNKVRHPNAN